MILHQLFTNIDDFCNHFLHTQNNHRLPNDVKQRHRPKYLCESEIITLVIQHFIVLLNPHAGMSMTECLFRILTNRYDLKRLSAMALLWKMRGDKKFKSVKVLKRQFTLSA